VYSGSSTRTPLTKQAADQIGSPGMIDQVLGANFTQHAITNACAW